MKPGIRNTILTYVAKSEDPLKVEIILKSIYGKLCGSYEVEEGTTKISTNFLSNGVYLLTFVNQSKIFKMIKQ